MASEFQLLLRRSIPILTLLVGIASSAWAQDYRAKVQGTITDSSGAAVIGAKIALVNTGTAATATRDSNNSGQYYFDLVEPGQYRLTVTHPGFNTFIQENIGVQVRADVTVNATLAVGNVTEEVTVSETMQGVKFNTSSVDLTIDRKMLTDLPILGRNPLRLALLDPMVVDRGWGANNPFDMWGGQTINIGGSTTEQNDILLDGAPITMTNKASYAPPMDAVQEFTVQPSGVDAEFGNSSGGVMNLQMKSGTNDFHGTAYYFGRNPKLNAVSNAVTRTPNFVRNHVWGGTLGNPIIKNKLFAFTAWEQWRTKDPREALRTMPTSLERTGNFSQSLNVNGGQRTIYDPWSTTIDAAGNVTRLPFEGNVIPQDRIDEAARKMMEDLWEPNNPGDNITGLNNFKESYQWTTNYWNFSHRSDYNITDKWRVFGRYSQFHNLIDEAHTVETRAMPRDEGGAMYSLNMAGDVIYVMNERTVLNFRGSYGSIQDDYYSAKAAVTESDLAAFWPSNWFKPYTKDLPAIYYPHLEIGDNYFGHREFWIEHPKNASGSFKMSQYLGAHNVKYGASYRRNFGLINYPDPMQFIFSPDMTANTFESPDTSVSGDPYASFLLGAMQDDSYASYVSPHELTINSWALYFQDDFKVTPKLTLNLGLRWEYETAPIDAKDRLSRYLDLTNPIPEMEGAGAPQIPAEVAQFASIPYKFNGAWVFSSNDHRGMFNTSKKGFAPRIGFAYRLGDSSSLRGGWARYITPVSLTQPLQPTQAALMLYGYTANTDVAPTLEGVPQVRLGDPFPANHPLTLPLEKSLGRYQNLGDDAVWARQDLKTGVSERFNLSFQHTLPASFVLDATYYFNYSYNLPTTRNLNLMDPRLSYQFQTDLERSVANPFYNFLTPDKFPGPLRYQEEVSVSDLLRPYPQYGSLDQNFTPWGHSKYQALALRMQRQFKGGASLLANYAYAFQKDFEFFNDIDEYDRKYTYIDSVFPRHRLNIAGSYDMPFGTGRKYASSMHPVLNGVFGGWSMSGIFTFNSGEFARFDGANVIGDPRQNVPDGAYWNPAAFEVLPAYTVRTNPWQYGGVTGPNNWNVDATLSKFFPLKGERVRLEFKLEAYNLTNSFIPSNPETDIESSAFGFASGQANRGREFQYTARIHF